MLYENHFDYAIGGLDEEFSSERAGPSGGSKKRRVNKGDD